MSRRRSTRRAQLPNSTARSTEDTGSDPDCSTRITDEHIDVSSRGRTHGFRLLANVTVSGEAALTKWMQSSELLNIHIVKRFEKVPFQGRTSVRCDADGRDVACARAVLRPVDPRLLFTSCCHLLRHKKSQRRRTHTTGACVRVVCHRKSRAVEALTRVFRSVEWVACPAPRPHRYHQRMVAQNLGKRI